MKRDEILKVFSTSNLDEVGLMAEILRLKAQLKISIAQVDWLDRLADELRDGDENDGSDELYRDYRKIKETLSRRLSDEYGIDI